MNILTVFLLRLTHKLGGNEKEDEQRAFLGSIKELLLNSSLSIPNQLVNLAINFIIFVLMARFLGPAEIGDYAIAIAIASIVFGIANFGLQAILTRQVSVNPDQAEHYLSHALSIRVFVSLPIGTASCYMLASFLGFDPGLQDLIMLTSIYVWNSSIVLLIYSLFQSVNRFHTQLTSNIIHKACSLLGSMGLLYFNCNIFQLMLFFTILQGLFIILLLVITRNNICKVKLGSDFSFCKKYILESLPLSLAGAAEFVNLKSDTIILGHYKSNVEAGIYNAAYNIYQGMMAIPYSVIVAFFPTFSRYYSHSKTQAYHFYKFIFILTAIVTITISLIVGLFSDDIVHFIYGSDFLDAGLIVLILSVSLPFLILNRLNNFVLITMKQQTWLFYLIFSGATFNLIANILVIPTYSYIGAAATTVLTELFMMGAGLIRIRQIFQINFNEEYIVSELQQ